MEIREFDEDLYNLVKLYLDSKADNNGNYEQMYVFALIAALEARKICLINMTLGRTFANPQNGE